MSFSFCELAVAYLQNLLMMFPLISDHPLRERIQLVECNLKQNAIEADQQSLDILDKPSTLTRAKDTDLLELYVQKNP